MAAIRGFPTSNRNAVVALHEQSSSALFVCSLAEPSGGGYTVFASFIKSVRIQYKKLANTGCGVASERENKEF
jgi:hypothetical protein